MSNPKDLAYDHVSWERRAIDGIMDAMWDLVQDNFEHGYKHGMHNAEKKIITCLECNRVMIQKDDVFECPVCTTEVGLSG